MMKSLAAVEAPRLPPPLQSEEDIRGREAELSEGLRSAPTPHFCLLCRHNFKKNKNKKGIKGFVSEVGQQNTPAKVERAAPSIHQNLGSGASFDWTGTILSVVSDDDGVKQDAELFSRSRPGVWRSELLLWFTVPEIDPFFRNTPPSDPALIRIYQHTFMLGIALPISAPCSAESSRQKSKFNIFFPSCSNEVVSVMW